MDNLASVGLLSALKPTEVSDDTKFINLFTCFFSPLMPPITPQFKVDVDLRSFGEIQHSSENKKPQKKVLNPKKMTLGELDDELKKLQKDFKSEFQKVSDKLERTPKLADLLKYAHIAEIIEQLNILKRFKKLRTSQKEE